MSYHDDIDDIKMSDEEEEIGPLDHDPLDDPLDEPESLEDYVAAEDADDTGPDDGNY